MEDSTGKIIKYNKERGFGFISSNQAEDIFFHISSILGLVIFPLEEKNVSFDLKTTKKGLEAIKIQLVNFEEANLVLIQNLNSFNQGSIYKLVRDKISLSEFIKVEIENGNPIIYDFVSKLPICINKNDPIATMVIKTYLKSKFEQSLKDEKITRNHWLELIEKEYIYSSNDKYKIIKGAGGTGKTQILYDMLNSDSILITLSNGEKSPNNVLKNGSIKTITQLLLSSEEIAYYDQLYDDAIDIFRPLQRKRNHQACISKLKEALSEINFKQFEAIFDNYEHNNKVSQDQYDHLLDILSSVRFKKYFTETAEKSITDKYLNDYLINSDDKDQLYGRMFKNRQVTYLSLIYLFCNNYLTIPRISESTLLVDDITVFGDNEWKVLNKLFQMARSHVITYDEFFKAYQFINAENHFGEYLTRYKPSMYYLTQNMRSIKPIVIEINEAINSIWGKNPQLYTDNEDEIMIKKKVNFFGWLQNAVNIKICIALRKNSELDSIEKFLIRYGISYIRLDRNFFETPEGEKYIFLFKYLLSKKPSSIFTNRTKENFSIIGVDYDLKKIMLDYDKGNKRDIIEGTKNGQFLIHILNYIQNESQNPKIKDFLHEFLDNIYLYPYYYTHYYKDIYRNDVYIYISTFHRLKQVREFDYVVFPQYSERETNDDEKSLSYLALSKARLGYGLFDFKRLGMNLIMETNFGEEVIYTDNEDAFKNITLYDTKEKSQTEDKVNYDLIFNVNEETLYRTHSTDEEDLPF
jgi:CspA family cold shock protein